jgi:tyrosyl-DNA phosphodiesterase 2
MASSSKYDAKDIQAMLAAKLAEPPPPRREDEFYQPREQSFYTFEQQQWRQIGGQSLMKDNAVYHLSKVHIITWNIDFMTPGAEPRMAAALDHLAEWVSAVPESEPVVIFLQEMTDTDLIQIQQTSWIQRRFHVTDIENANWLTPMYGTVTLVDKSLPIHKVFRVPWYSQFERDGLFVDVAMGSSSDKAQILRLCNVHLESLAIHPPARPDQLSDAALYLNMDSVHAAILGGDLNAIEPFDRTLHSENGLKDVYLELGGKEDTDEGYTWGYHVPAWLREKFGCSRMDKILYRGPITPTELKRIGVDVKVSEDYREAIKTEGGEEWVTDHYGLMATFENST